MAQIKLDNGSLVWYIEDEIIIDLIEVKHKRCGTGRILISELKDIAIQKGLPISLCSYPQDDSITQSDLDNFYLNNGFVVSGYPIYIWKP